MDTMTRTTYNTLDVARLTGATYRQLDSWANRGLVGEPGSGSGTARRWSEIDVKVARVLFRLLNLGCAGSCLEAISEQLNRLAFQFDHYDYLLVTSDGRCRLIADDYTFSNLLAGTSNEAWLVTL